jgi:hypothetical protein
MMQADTPPPAYAQQRRIFGDMMAAAMNNGDDPAIVARVIVAAATDPKPRLRYTAGPAAGRISTLRRVVPARVFDKQIRKLNRLAGIRQPALAADGDAVASSRLP